jgi:hypothetical protein
MNMIVSRQRRRLGTAWFLDSLIIDEHVKRLVYPHTMRVLGGAWRVN